MAIVTITDDGSSIKLVKDGSTTSITKPYTVSSDGTYITIKSDENRWHFAYSDVTSPTSATIDALRILLEGYNDSTINNYNYSVALGKVSGSITWNKFAHNNDIDIGTETVWNYGGTFARINTASTFTVVSSSAQDTLTTGTGAWNVVIYYIDANRVSQTVVVPLNGTTPVVTSVTGLGINRVALYNTGSGDINAGDITITATTGGSVQAFIQAGEGVSQQAIFFTQDSHTFLVDWLYINICKIVGGGGSPRVTVKAWVYSYVSTAKYLVYQETIDTSIQNSIELTPSQPFVIGEKSILFFEATTDINNTTVNLRFSGIEFSNTDV